MHLRFWFSRRRRTVTFPHKSSNIHFLVYRTVLNFLLPTESDNVVGRRSLAQTYHLVDEPLPLPALTAATPAPNSTSPLTFAASANSAPLSRFLQTPGIPAFSRRQTVPTGIKGRSSNPLAKIAISCANRRAKPNDALDAAGEGILLRQNSFVSCQSNRIEAKGEKVGNDGRERRRRTHKSQTTHPTRTLPL